LSRGIFGRKLHNSEYLQNRPASRNAMRKDDVLVELAVIKKDLPHWTDEVIEQWLLMLANRGTDTVGIRPSRWETTPGNTFSAHADARQGGLSTGLVSRRGIYWRVLPPRSPPAPRQVDSVANSA
jgi:hypothetical protein